MAARVTRVAIESLVLPSAKARVTQGAVEVLGAPNAPRVRSTSVVIEVLGSITPKVGAVRHVMVVTAG